MKLKSTLLIIIIFSLIWIFGCNSRNTDNRLDSSAYTTFANDLLEISACAENSSFYVDYCTLQIKSMADNTNEVCNTALEKVKKCRGLAYTYLIFLDENQPTLNKISSYKEVKFKIKRLEESLRTQEDTLTAIT